MIVNPIFAQIQGKLGNKMIFLTSLVLRTYPPPLRNSTYDIDAL